MQFSAEHVEIAVARARSETEAAVATARAEATVAERERFAAVLKLPEAQSRKKQALALALAGAEPSHAKALLNASQPDAAEPAAFLGPRSRDAVGGLVVIDASGDPGLGLSPRWDGAIAKANAKL